MRTYRIKYFKGVRAFSNRETTGMTVTVLKMDGVNSYDAVAKAVKQGFIDPDEDGVFSRVEEEL